jgi:adenylate cyclase
VLGPRHSNKGPLTVHGRAVPDAEARLNIKAAVVGRARAEYDYAVPMADAQQMLDTLCIGLVDKTRHYVERDGLTWEIDEFSGANAGLIVAEVELEAEEQAIVRPDWLGQEVTDDRRYYNHALSLHPFRAWPENLGKS